MSSRAKRHATLHRRVVEGVTRSVSWCPACARDTFTTRKAAKADAKRRDPGTHYDVWRCPDGRGYWHHAPISLRAVRGEDPTDD